MVKQNEVLTKEEALQLTMDRKLAEKLQAEYNSQDINETVEERQQGSKTSGCSVCPPFTSEGTSSHCQRWFGRD